MARFIQHKNALFISLDDLIDEYHKVIEQAINPADIHLLGLLVQDLEDARQYTLGATGSPN